MGQKCSPHIQTVLLLRIKAVIGQRRARRALIGQGLVEGRSHGWMGHNGVVLHSLVLRDGVHVAVGTYSGPCAGFIV